MVKKSDYLINYLMFYNQWSYSEKKYYFGIVKSWLFGLFILMTCAILIWYGFNNSRWDVQVIVTIIIFMLGFGSYLLYKKIFYFIDKVDNKIIREIDIAKKGKQGEDLVFDELNKILDNKEYFIIKNYRLPGRQFDIDFIVVGPKGIILLEVKNLSNDFVFTKDKYFVFTRNYADLKLLPQDKDPRFKMQEHADLFTKYLDKIGYFSLKPKMGIIFIKENSIYINDSGIGIYLINGLKSLDKFLDEVYLDNRFTPEFCAEVYKKLDNK